MQRIARHEPRLLIQYAARTVELIDRDRQHYRKDVPGQVVHLASVRPPADRPVAMQDLL